MTVGDSEQAARAYDNLASTYDDQVEGEGWMRPILWDLYQRRFQPGDHVLDLGCGTGIDAVHLAAQGIRVTGIDASEAMAARTLARGAEAGLSHLVSATVLPFDRLSALQPRRFAGCYSSFASLSSVADMPRLARDVADLLPSGSPLIVHLLNRGSLWEYLSFARRRRWEAARRCREARERTFVISGIPVAHRMWRPRELFSAGFDEEFELRGARGLGVLRPPPAVRWMPAPVTAALSAADGLLGARRPWLDWGRFFILDMQRR